MGSPVLRGSRAVRPGPKPGQLPRGVGRQGAAHSQLPPGSSAPLRPVYSESTLEGQVYVHRRLRPWVGLAGWDECCRGN